MKASIRDLSGALVVTAALVTMLAGCDGGSSGRTSAGTGTGTGASTGASSAAGGSSGGAASGGSTTTGRAKDGSPVKGTTGSHPGGVAASATRSQAEVPVAAADPCKLTSSTDVIKAFGGSVITASAGISGTGSSTCHYVLSRTRNGAGLVLDISLTRHVTRTVFDGVKEQAGNRGVTGVGQDAYYRSSTKALQIYVRGSVAAMQATPTKTITAAQREALRTDQISLGRSIASAS